MCPSKLLASLALVAAAACGGPTTDDPVGLLPDASVGGTQPDAPTVVPLTCASERVLPKYPWGVTAGTYIANERMTFGILADSTSTAGSRLTVEVWPGMGGSEPIVPMTETFSTSDKYKTCENCVLIGEGCTTQPNNCRTWYFAQAGSLRIDKAGRSEAAGELRATGSNVTFVEWSLTADAPVPGGRCITVSHFDMAAEWGDGGACSGDSCGSGCCSDSPYCTLGNNNIGRYCSDFCGESGDGCTGPSDCCDGFSCFLGTCIVDSCGGDTCSSGLDSGGGCCDQNAYCVGGHCAAACGMAGSGCGDTLDCCTGLTCSGGTCQ